MSSNIPPHLPPKFPQSSPRPDDSGSSSIWQRVRNAVTSIFQDSTKKEPLSPNMGAEIEPLDMEAWNYLREALGHSGKRTDLRVGLALIAIRDILSNNFGTYESTLKQLSILIHEVKPHARKDIFLEKLSKKAFIHFFDDLELYQKSGMSLDLSKALLKDMLHHFASNLEYDSPVLQAQGGIDIPATFLRIYDIKELELHFKILKNLFKKEIPCAITLSTPYGPYNQPYGEYGELVITYDLKTSSWTVIDHGHITKSLSENSLAHYVHGAISFFNKFRYKPQGHESLCTIITNVCTTKDKSASLQKILERDCSDLLATPNLSKQKLVVALENISLLRMIFNDDLPMFQAVLEQGGIPSIEKLNKIFDSYSWNELVLILKNKNPAFASLIIKQIRDAFVDKKDKEGNTFLFAAVEANDIPLVKLLLEKGAYPNQRNSNEKTPLDIALDNNFLELAKLLGPRPKL